LHPQTRRRPAERESSAVIWLAEVADCRVVVSPNSAGFPVSARVMPSADLTDL
jgi:hypothetical protein